MEAPHTDTRRTVRKRRAHSLRPDARMLEEQENDLLGSEFFTDM